MSVKKSSVYTRTGDKGESSLYNLQRKPKDDKIFEALGDVDELNANLGLSTFHCIKSKNNLEEKLKFIQSRLLDVGSCIATPLDSSKVEKINKVAFSQEHLIQLENWIDELDSKLPKLTNFILPSGGETASHLHIARTICRRAERKVVSLVRDDLVDPIVMKFLNRLSDFLFVCARHSSHFENQIETVYKK
eukprot:gene1821-963_t